MKRNKANLSLYLMNKEKTVTYPAMKIVKTIVVFYKIKKITIIRMPVRVVKSIQITGIASTK